MADVPWDGCAVSFYVNREVDIGDVNHCDELPRGWMCLSAGPRSSRSSNHDKRFVIEFAVAAPTERDGQIVRRILQRLGAQ